MNTWNSLALVVLSQVTIITLVAAIAIRFSVRRAALRHAIGVVALAFVLASPGIAMLLPQSPWLSVISQTAEPVEAPAIERPTEDAAFDEMVMNPPHREASQSVDEPIASRVGPQESDIVAPTSIVDPSAIPIRWTELFAATNSVWLSSGFAIVLWVWAVGIVVYGIRFLLLRRQLQILASSIKREPIDRTLVDQACELVGLKQVPTICASDLAPMPFVLGCIQPVIVLPRSLVETGSEARLREVLIHEFAHVVRRDPWINAAQNLARVIFWLHPGVHWLNRQIARSREEVCDNFVLAKTNSADYAQTLLELAESCGSARFGLSLLGMFLPRWNLERRIADILNPNRIKSTRTSRKSVAIVSLLFAAICVVIGGVGLSAQDIQEPTAQPSAPAANVAESNPAATTQELQTITIRGTCFDQDSMPIGQCRTRLYQCQVDNSPPVLLADVQSQEGRFSIPYTEVIPSNFATMRERVFLLVVTADGYSTLTKTFAESQADVDQVVELSGDVEVLSGFVADEDGRPINDAKVFLQTGVLHYIPDCKSAVTNDQGQFRIKDLQRFNPEDHRTFDPKTQTGTMIGSAPIYISHPNYALTQAEFSRIPQSITVALSPPATIEGRVIDDVTGEPVPNVSVFAEGIARFDSFQTKTDADGKYLIRTNKDHFNLWAEADDRIAIASKAIAVTAGQKVENTDIRMIRGGVIVGTVIDRTTGRPIESMPAEPFYVRHQGPARPLSGRASTAALVESDGTFRLRVAPGKNYLFDRSNHVLETVDVLEGEEVNLELQTVDRRTADSPDLADPDFKLFQRLFAQAQEEDKIFPKVKRKQEPSAPQKPSDDDYRFERSEFFSKPNIGFETASSLLEVAISKNAPEATIARLRVDKAQMALNCPEFANRFQVVFETLEPVVIDPSPLLSHFESAKLYVDAVFFYVFSRSQIDKDAFSPESSIQRAMADVESAMGLNDRERFVLTGWLRSIASDFSVDNDNLNEAIAWLKPVLDGQELLADDSYSVELLNLVIRLQSWNFAQLGRIDESALIVENGVAILKTSPAISDARKLNDVGHLLACQLMNCREHWSDPAAAGVWRNIDAHLVQMEAFQGPERIEFENIVLELHRARMAFLGSRDLDRTVQVAEQMLDHYDKHSEMANRRTEYHRANEGAIDVLEMLREAKHPRKQELQDRIVAFESKFGRNPTDGEPGKIE